jgi:hypothetical protein
MARSIGSQASTELLDCSVISNWTGRSVFFWTIVARCRTFTPEQMSSIRSLTRSQARSLLSIARLNIARSCLDRAISRRTRMDQTCFGSRGFFWPMSNPLFQARWPLLIERTGMRDPPPPRPPRRSNPSVSLYADWPVWSPREYSRPAASGAKRSFIHIQIIEHEFCKNFHIAPMISTPSWHSLLMDRSDHADNARLTDHASALDKPSVSKRQFNCVGETRSYVSSTKAGVL